MTTIIALSRIKWLVNELAKKAKKQQKKPRSRLRGCCVVRVGYGNYTISTAPREPVVK
jgi:hypothetical protein